MVVREREKYKGGRRGLQISCVWEKVQMHRLQTERTASSVLQFM